MQTTPLTTEDFQIRVHLMTPGTFGRYQRADRTDASTMLRAQRYPYAHFLAAPRQDIDVRSEAQARRASIERALGIQD